MSQFLEMVMIICFGLSWPLSIRKSYTSRTNKGKSVFFIIFILIGYGVGIANKFISDNLNYVVVFYMINFVLVAIDIGLYVRNMALDRQSLAES
jgi:uncharacterized membrane protein YczE